MSSKVRLIIYVSLLCSFTLGCSSTKPGITINSGQFTRTVVLKDFFPGTITNIQSGDFDPNPGNEIAVLAQTGVWLLSPDDYKLIRRIKFRDKSGDTLWFGLNPQLTDIDRDGVFEIMMGGGGYGRVGVLNNKGVILWEFGSDFDLPPEIMIQNTSNKDAYPDFYTAGYTGLHKLNSKGEIVWRIDDEWFVDLKTIGAGKLVALSNRGEYVLLDAEGNIENRFKALGRPFGMWIVEWPSEIALLTGYFRKKIRLTNLHGEIVFEHELENFPLFHNPEGLAVRFDKNRPPYLVILANSRLSSSLTQVNIFSSEGILIYQEALNTTTGFAVGNDRNTGNEVLLIGNGTGELLEFKLRHEWLK